MSQLLRLLVAREIKQVIGGAFFLIHPVVEALRQRPAVNMTEPEKAAEQGGHP